MEVGTEDRILTSAWPVSTIQQLSSLNTYPVYDTHTTASTFLSAASSSLFVRILAASANPNRLWSVNTVRMPIKCEWNTASCAKLDSPPWPWTKLICSRSTMVRKYGRKVRKLGNVADEAMVCRGMWYTLMPGRSQRIPTRSGGCEWVMMTTCAARDGE